MISIYTQATRAAQWLERYWRQKPLFACVLGFTETGLVPGISAAGATLASRRYTAVADAEFLINGPSLEAQYPLPPLTQGISPVFISRAVLQGQGISIRLFDAGLPMAPSVEAVALGGQPAKCLSTGTALPLSLVQALFQQGLQWGETLARQASYLILSECVVGGTTTAMAVLTGLGFDAQGKVNSSHPICNHDQKGQLVRQGLRQLSQTADPLEILATVGDPMQVVTAGMMIAASRESGVLLAGGTQMLAVYAVGRAIAQSLSLPWNPDQVVVGTTRWVAEDPTGDTVGLANAIGQVPLLATQLSFAASHYPQLSAYEAGFVKEGVGAGGCAIAAHLFQDWDQQRLLTEIEALVAKSEAIYAGAHEVVQP
jgi:uncharacterized protein (TIGR00303 family)